MPMKCSALMLDAMMLAPMAHHEREPSARKKLAEEGVWRGSASEDGVGVSNDASGDGGFSDSFAVNNDDDDIESVQHGALGCEQQDGKTNQA